MNTVIIYTASYCPYCHLAKELLRTKGATFEEID
ncbi:MAG: glutaredoxin domain-containing protein, partial [Rhodoplanes sp.]